MSGRKAKPKIDFYSNNNITNIDKVLWEIEKGTYITGELELEDYGDFEEDEVPEWVYVPKLSPEAEYRKKIQKENAIKLARSHAENLAIEKQLKAEKLASQLKEREERKAKNAIQREIDKKEREEQKAIAKKEREERVARNAKIREKERLTKLMEKEKIHQRVRKEKIELQKAKALVAYDNGLVYDDFFGISCNEKNLEIIIKNNMNQDYEPDPNMGNLLYNDTGFMNTIDIYDSNKMVKYYRDQRYNRIWDEDFLWDDEF